MGWRVRRHQDFLHRALRDWSPSVQAASREELKTLTDIVRNVYDRVVKVPSNLLVPLTAQRAKVRRVSALSAPLYERRRLLLELGANLVPVIRAVLQRLRVPR